MLETAVDLSVFKRVSLEDVNTKTAHRHGENAENCRWQTSFMLAHMIFTIIFFLVDYYCIFFIHKLRGNLLYQSDLNKLSPINILMIILKF